MNHIVMIPGGRGFGSGAGSSRRCLSCLGENARVSLSVLAGGYRVPWELAHEGVCEKCKATEDVFDLPALLMLRRRGLLNVAPSPADHGEVPEELIQGQPGATDMPRARQVIERAMVQHACNLLAARPAQAFLHPTLGSRAEQALLMRFLGTAPPEFGGEARTVDAQAPLTFGLQAAQDARDSVGANCGPGALAAVAGISPLAAAKVIPDFLRRHYTTEVMLGIALARLGIRFTWRDCLLRGAYAMWPCHALVRIAFGDPDEDRMVLLSKSHWIACRRSSGGATEIFDINAIGSGGWIAFEEWAGHLVPWLAGTVLEIEDPRWVTVETLDLEGRE